MGFIHDFLLNYHEIFTLDDFIRLMKSDGVKLNREYARNILDSSDKPVISLEGYVQASSAVRICLSVNDMLKLLGAEERPYAGQYVANSGNASLFVKFLF